MRWGFLTQVRAPIRDNKADFCVISLFVHSLSLLLKPKYACVSGAHPLFGIFMYLNNTLS